ncbi:MAG: hybrid sensor histidine kinase/response regulator [Bacteroidales bacterium]|nr:hybrid sensor histidine kinase/response regulator [Bacteroidales bacterium]
MPPIVEVVSFNKKVLENSNAYIEWKGVDMWNRTPKTELRFSHKLDNGAWSAYTKNTSIRLENLSTGMHYLQIRAIDGDLNISTTPCQVQFRVLPNWYKRPLVLLLIAAAIAIAIYYQLKLYNKKKALAESNLKLMHETNQKVENAIKIERLKTRQKIEIERMKVQFFTNISHEFRTPLTLIKAPLISLIEKGSQHENDTSLIQTALRNTNKLSQLVNQLLDLRKLENSTLPLMQSKVMLVQFVRETLHSFQYWALNNKIELTFSSSANEIEILTDKDKLDKILFNLLSNAFKHAPTLGTVGVSLAHKHNKIFISIHNSGKPIPVAERNKIFDPYYQITPGETEGTGIGLSICKEFIEIMGGSIEVGSPAVGTVFNIILPAKTFMVSKGVIQETLSTNQHSEQVDAHNIRDFKNNLPIILIVEDSFELNSFLKLALNDEFNVLQAQNGNQALEIIHQVYPDLIISDVMMPGMNGFELCDKIKNNSLTSYIPFILLTARSTHHDHINWFKHGCK